jgi:hypothetical protein
MNLLDEARRLSRRRAQRVDQELASAWRPAVGTEDWQLWIGDAAERFREFLVDWPAALHVYLRYPVVAPAARDRMEAMIEVLKDGAGLSDADAFRVYGEIDTYTIGFAAVQSTRERWGADVYEVGELGMRLARFTTPPHFASAIEDLLNGLDRRPTQHSAVWLEEDSLSDLRGDPVVEPRLSPSNWPVASD